MTEKKEENFLEKFGLEVSTGKVEVGQTYPIYGMITKIIQDYPLAVIVEINFSIIANLSISQEDQVNIIKERSFEPGIFVSTVKTSEPQIEVDCSTVVFGKRQNFNA
jgi:hypothetical protein